MAANEKRSHNTREMAVHPIRRQHNFSSVQRVEIDKSGKKLSLMHYGNAARERDRTRERAKERQAQPYEIYRRVISSSI